MGQRHLRRLPRAVAIMSRRTFDDRAATACGKSATIGRFA
ncbi:hypothetical protein BMF35_a0034 [Aurantiacibacter gangjinensis]|nr:hypothetical protein BMF35_a0034 [Aurantiacibacter gangjinensis]